MPKSRSGVLRQALGPVRTKLINNVTVATQQLVNTAIPTDSKACQKLADDIREYLDKIQGCIKTILERDNQWQTLIFGLTDETELTEEEELYAKWALDSKEGYLNLVEHSKDIVCKLDRKAAEAKRQLEAPAAVTPAATANETTDTKCAAKLPKLLLPTFSGDYCEWPSFWAIFKTNIHDQRLSASEKFAYLLGQLTEPAKKPIAGITIEDQNYEIALKILRERYERPAEHMVGTLYSQLKRLPPASTNVADLQETYDHCEKLFRRLEAAGEDVNANRSLTLEVFSKYPHNVIKDLTERHNVGSYSSLGDIRKALQKYISQSENLSEILQDLDPFGVSKSSRGKVETKSGNRDQQASPSEQKHGLQTSAFAVAAPNKQGSNNNNTASNNNNNQSYAVPQNPCYFCGGDHFNSGCTMYTTAAQRAERLQAIGRCSRCMSTAHAVKNCRASGNRLQCYFCKSTNQHVSPMCTTKFATSDTIQSPVATEPLQIASSGKSTDTGSNLSNLLSNTEQSLLLTAVARVYNPSSQVYIRARIIFDTGSHRSFVTKPFAEQLQLSPLSEDPLNIAVFGTKRSVSVTSLFVRFEIEQLDGTRRSVEAHTSPLITSCNIPPCNIPYEDMIAIDTMKYKMADDFESSDGSIDILIGSDYFWEFVTGSREAMPSGLYLIPSTVGYLLGGRCNDDAVVNKTEEISMLCLTESSCQRPLESNLTAVGSSHFAPRCPDVDEFWDLEAIGIRDDPIVRDDDQALQQFNDSVYHANGRYYVSWPWKKNQHQLPSNYELALGRFRSLAKRLRTCEPDVLEKYAAVIDDQLKKGVIEQVPPDEICQQVNVPIHYLPHHPVVKPSSATTKVRVVYDASAKTRKDNPSLNECLYRGPVILPDLCQILIRFRIKAVGVVADVEKAFLQMCLQPDDRDVTRFLWFRDPTNPCVEDNIMVYRFCRVPFGVISSPFLLGATVLHHLLHYDSWVAADLSKNMYVDNGITSLDGPEVAADFYKTSKSIFSAAGMNLQQWGSNCDTFLATIPPDDKTKARDIKVLGLQWDCEDDSLRVKRGLSAVTVSTKREVLQWVASVYDPLGFFQPVLIRAKIFLQQLWQKQYGWDSCLDPVLAAEWEVIRSEIEPMFDIRIPRSPCPVTSVDGCNTSLVVFCDASAHVYATVIYLRTFDVSQNRWNVNLVYSKSRLAPRKKQTSSISLPRLELLGVAIGARAAAFVRNAFKSTSDIPIYLFTDSMCVLHWLRSTKLLSVFVGNRVTEIQKLQNASFLYVNTSSNPADYTTRGKTAKELKADTLWWSGPEWLENGRDEWPVSCDAVDGDSIPDQAKSEFRKDKLSSTNAVLLNVNVGGNLFGIDPTRYSSFRRLARVTAWCYKFVKLHVYDKLLNVQEAKAKLPEVACISSDKTLRPGDLNVAITSIVRSVQQEKFGDVFRALENNGKHTLVKQLGLGLDEDHVLRCYGRFEHADLPYDSIQPRLLPKDHTVTTLIVRENHEKLFHAGVGHTLSQIRRQFWIPKGRASVKRVLTRCHLCRRLKGAPFALPRMPPWPRERVSKSKPFQFIGLDYMGPLSVRVGEGTQKMWVCLFTCLAIRAVHLEWVSDCSAKEFMAAVIRFVSRRGTPEQIISDNAPQFRTTKTTFDRMWHNIFRDEEIQAYYSERAIVWKFTTELAPWQGGFYERFVGIVKGTLKSAIGRRLLRWEEFLTLIAEVEAIVNSRPITYVYSDFPSGLALRPCDFITELAVGMPVTSNLLKLDGLGDAGRDLIRLWKHKQGRLDAIWKQWYDEYLLSLRERGGSHHKGKRSEVAGFPSVNDVVLVKESDTPRGNWKLGLVTEIIVGRDGNVRSAVLTLPNKAAIRRPINHLYPIELPPVDTAHNDDESEQFDGFEPSEVNDAIDRVRGFQLQQQQATNNINQGLATVAAKLLF